jgi:hypothetical protein
MLNISEQVKELEERCNAYERIIKYCMLKYDKAFDVYINEFRKLGLNKALSKCPFPDSCVYYKYCEEPYCRYNMCDNGYPGYD